MSEYGKLHLKHSPGEIFWTGLALILLKYVDTKEAPRREKVAPNIAQQFGRS